MGALFAILVLLIPLLIVGGTQQHAALVTRWGRDLLELTKYSSHGNISHQTLVHPEYPRPQLVRDKSSWKNLNGLWSFDIIEKNVPITFPLRLTHKIRVPFVAESLLSGLGNISVTDNDKLIYHNFFVVPQNWLHNRVILHFGAIDWHSKVYINGNLVSEHVGGYDSFSVEVTDYLVQQKHSKQGILVEVTDPTDKGFQPRGKQVQNPFKIWYTSVSGIWQTVWLEVVPKSLSIRDVKITPNFDILTIRVDMEIAYSIEFVRSSLQKSDQRILLSVVVLDGNNVIKASKISIQASITSQAVGYFNKSIACELDVRGVDLWTPETPRLYRVVFKLGYGTYAENNKLDSNTTVLNEVDNVISYFGMRKISLGADPHNSSQIRLFLNEKPYFQMGLLDQGFWPDGLYTAPTDAALKYDIEVSKKLGFNMIRKHVKVEPDRWYYWCDVLGMLVWQDMPSGDAETLRYVGPDINKSPQSAAQFYKEWNSIMNQLHNHPSVVMWVIFNEGWGQFDTKAVYSFTKAKESLHPQRLINVVSGWIDRGVGDVIDVHNYPKPIAPVPQQDRASVLGEYGGLGLYVDRHCWHPMTEQQVKRSWSYKTIKDRAALTDEFVRMLGTVKEYRDKLALSAAIYTQTTDVEGEVNGIMTYDRDILKLNAEIVQRALPLLTGNY